ncbi:hypothetical protein NDU88_003648 [Pleurodeles waltl]|uniref:Uncharacterized protein n=1 Tax=Pleurodeles waltl TaxID=8319 RepID=A0AAV7WSX4_PLEWA|nr:hypothetical protein NDU88_003648 [Pleurodeles waltl]
MAGVGAAITTHCLTIHARRAGRFMGTLRVPRLVRISADLAAFFGTRLGVQVPISGVRAGHVFGAGCTRALVTARQALRGPLINPGGAPRTSTFFKKKHKIQTGTEITQGKKEILGSQA